MSQELLICPHCQYENIVLTCGFCLQCGEDVSAAPLIPQLRAEASTPGCSAAGFEDTTLSQLITQAAAKLKASHTEIDRGWRLTIRVGGGRKQTVHVLRGGEDEGLELVAFLSLCGPARPDLAMKLLEWNSRLIHCAVRGPLDQWRADDGTGCQPGNRIVDVTNGHGCAEHDRVPWRLRRTADERGC